MLSAFVLAAFVKLSIITEQPLLCAGLFTGVTALRGIIGMLEGSTTLAACFLGVALAGGLSFAYFWGLNHVQRGSSLWWGIAVGGPVLAVFVL